MTLTERLAAAQSASVKLYLQRQQLEQQFQQIQLMRIECDQALLKSDGEIDVLTQLVKLEQSNGQ
jgi:hypothetical protein